MKKFKIILFAAIVALIGVACEDDKEMIIMDIDKATPAQLITPADGSSYTLTAETGVDTFEVFSWTKAEYGVTLAQDFYLEIDPTSNTFATPSELYRGIDAAYKMTNAELNLILYDAGASGEVTSYIRVVTAIKKADVDTLFSESSSFKVSMFDYNKPAINKPSNGSSFVLTSADAEKDFATFVWDLINYGGEFSDKYDVEFDLPENNFESPQKLKTVFGENKYTATVEEVNTLLIKKLKVTAGEAADIEIRIKGEAGSKRGIVLGDPITLNIKTYDPDSSGGTEPSYLWVPGDYQGWAPADATKITSAEDNGIYVGTVIFPDDSPSFNFKFTSAPDWDHINYGNGGDGVLDTDNSAGNLSVPEAGTYEFTVNTNDLTWSYTKQ